MKNANTFRTIFNSVRRQLAKVSGFGFGFEMSAERMKQAFREAMIAAHVPATKARINLVNNWIDRANKLSVA